MLWNSGASVTVMSEKYWVKIGKPLLASCNIRLNGAFTDSGEKPLGTAKLNMYWSKKVRTIQVMIVRQINQELIGDIDTMHNFRVRLMEINNIEADCLK